MESSETTDLYWQFVAATEKKDRDAVCRIIRNHPELHDFVGDDGDFIGIIDSVCPDFMADAFAAGLHPDSGERGLISFLQGAACDNDVESIKLALSYGADIECRNESGETALGYAAGWKNLDAVRALLEGGADVNAVEYDPKDGCKNTALDCCSPEYKEIYELLRSYGAKTWKELCAEQNQKEN